MQDLVLSRMSKHGPGGDLSFSRHAWSISVNKAFFLTQIAGKCNVCFRLNLNLIVMDLSNKLTTIRHGSQQKRRFLKRILVCICHGL